MNQSFITTPRSQVALVGRLFTWSSGIICTGLLFLVMGLITHQVIVPPPAPRIILLRNIPLPEGLKAMGAPDTLTPATSQFFDHFDFQSIDFNTHLLFIAHSGPVPDDQALYDH